MNDEQILKNIAKHIDLNENEVAYFLSLVKRKSVSKNTLLLNSGEACQHISYVHSGVLRAYYLDRQGKQATVMFAVEDWWVTDMYCF